MPLYEYQCDACGRRFEKIRKFSDPPVETCPTCGGHVQKVVSAPAFQLKGTGWYITDYAKKDSGGAGGAAKDGAAKDAKTDATEKSGTDKTGTDKTEKPAEKEKSSTSSEASAPAASTSTSKDK